MSITLAVVLGTAFVAAAAVLWMLARRSGQDRTIFLKPAVHSSKGRRTMPPTLSPEDEARLIDKIVAVVEANPRAWKADGGHRITNGKISVWTANAPYADMEIYVNNVNVNPSWQGADRLRAAFTTLILAALEEI